jgi:hypothetical protein
MEEEDVKIWKTKSKNEYLHGMKVTNRESYNGLAK